MLGQSSLVALVAASPALAVYQGFNYGSTFTTGAAKVQADFEAEFKTAQGLISAPGVFNSARLYTTVVSLSMCIVLFDFLFCFVHMHSLFCNVSLACTLRLTPIPARRHLQQPHPGHSGGDQHQDLPPDGPVGLGR